MYYKVNSQEVEMEIFTVILDPILISDPDPRRQIISDPGGSGSDTTTLVSRQYGTFAVFLSLLFC
jgi:hypothetical protein